MAAERTAKEALGPTATAMRFLGGVSLDSVGGPVIVTDRLSCEARGKRRSGRKYGGSGRLYRRPSVGAVEGYQLGDTIVR